MKSSSIAYHLQILILLICFTIATGCKKNTAGVEDCTPDVRVNALNGISYDANPNSPFYLKQAVIHYFYRQELTSYTSVKCGQDKSSVELQLENLTDKKILFDYHVRAIDRQYSVRWEYFGTTEIRPWSKINVGEISQNTFSLENDSNSSGHLSLIINKAVYD